MKELFAWTFTGEVKKATKEEETLLIAGEQVLGRYKTIRDIALITDKRLIIIDSQGMTGKKKEIYVIPFKSINMYSTENSGTLDFNSEIQLWTRAGNFKLKLKKGIDVHRINQLIAEHIC